MAEEMDYMSAFCELKPAICLKSLDNNAVENRKHAVRCAQCCTLVLLSRLLLCLSLKP